ncbi:MAG: ribonuclease III domain-containing protein [Anaerovoracaceae bacterium]|nr:ribonuclease III domain-containing protein [Anaerovoracaceae bacterium]
MDREKVKMMNTTALAYMGDAVYEQAVREHILSTGTADVNRLHRLSTGYVSAKAQSAIVRSLFDDLTEEEQRLVKRARNRKYRSKSRSADPVTYKWATAFEALVGYLYLAEEEGRLSEIMERAFAIAEER